MKKLRITVEGKAYEVTVEFLDQPASPFAPVTNPTAAPTGGSRIEAPTSAKPATPAPSAGGPGVVTSPLAGKVISIDAAVGKRVQSGDTVVTLEAMKMNTFVHTSTTGTVAEVLVQIGDAVEEGQGLIRIVPE
jgi:biotin carboxyl carrier protein